MNIEDKLADLVKDHKYVDAKNLMQQNTLTDSNWIQVYSNSKGTMREFARIVMFKEPPAKVELDQILITAPTARKPEIRDISCSGLYIYLFQCTYDG